MNRKTFKQAVALAGIVIVVSNNLAQFSQSLLTGDVIMYSAIFVVILGVAIDTEIVKALR